MSKDEKIKPKISREVAEAEFYRFCEAQRIDTDETDFSEEDLEGFNEHKIRFIKAVMNGFMVVNDSAEAEFTALDANHCVTFKKPKASSLMALDRCKKGQDTKSMFELMADMTGQPSGSVFTKMDLVDAKVCQSVAALFLAS